MKRFSLGSLRVRLCLVVLLAVIPSLGLIYYSAREQRAAANALAWQDIARIARLTAEYQRAVIEDTHQLLVVLAQLPVIRDVDPSRGGPMLGKLLGEYPLYSNLGVVASDGNVLCSAIPLKEPVSVADSPWFQQAMKTRDFAVGEYQMSAFSSYPLLNFGYPIVGSDDRA